MQEQLIEAGYVKDPGACPARSCEKGVKPEGFVGMAMPDFARRVFDPFKEKVNTEVFLAMPPGHAIIDPGAGQDLIGKPAYS